MKQCKFEKAWAGRCKNQAEPGKDFCAEHSKIICASCGQPATHECDETGQFVCNAALCDDCEHTIAKDGTNGGIGFFRTAPLPQGYKDHCRKDAQVYKPWYEREKPNES